MFRTNGRCKDKNFYMIFVVCCCLLIAAFITLSLVFNKNLNNLSEARIIEERLSRYVELPKDEQPVVSLLSDADILADDGYLYRDAQVGDKVLTYGKAQKVVVFRESTNRVVLVAPILESPAVRESRGAKIYIYSTSADDKRVIELSDKIAAHYPLVQIRPIIVAKISNVSGVVMENAKNSKAELDAKLLPLVGAVQASVRKIVNAPADADFVIVVGATKK